MSQEWRGEPDWIGIDAQRYRDHSQRAKTVTLQMPKETKQPVGFAPPQPPAPQIHIPAVYRAMEPREDSNPASTPENGER